MMSLSFQLAAIILATGFLIVWLAGQRRAVGESLAEGAANRGEARRPNRPSVFSIRGLRKDYPSPAGPVTAVRNVNIEIGEGVTAIVGPSGGGKTTLLNCIGGLDVPTSGQVWFCGTRLDFDDGEVMRQFRAEGVAWVFQELNLITHQSVAENVALPLLCRGVKRREALETAKRMLNCLDIGHFASRSREQLSRGQQQRVAIARAFASDAAVVLADEPTGSLDPETAETVMQAFRWMSHVEGKPVVLVTHNHELARKYCDRVLLCAADGLREMAEETVADGSIDGLAADDRSPSTEGISFVPPGREQDRLPAQPQTALLEIEPLSAKDTP
jgi:putative ABC transport system ATP-binding protein